MEIVLNKGETILRAEVQRTSKGLVIRAKAHPCVEEYFQSLSSSAPVGIENYGRNWINEQNPEERFMVYRGVVGGLQDYQNGTYVLNVPGTSMIHSQNEIDPRTGLLTQKDSINLSFLSIKGISDGTGIAFSVRGPVSREHVEKLAEGIKAASKAFYLQFLRPVNMVITMTVQEATII